MAETERTSNLAAWLVPLVVVGGLLAWLLLTDDAPGPPADGASELSEEEAVDPTFEYDVR